MKFILYFIFPALLMSAPAFAAVPVDTGSETQKLFNKLSRDLQCLCGCNATIAKCPHGNDCGYAEPARIKMRAMLKEGKTYDDVISYFIKREGEVALSSPTKKGFNLFGYAAPFLAIVAAGSGVVVTVSRWAKKGGSKTASQTDQGRLEDVDGEFAEKLKKEREEFEA